MFGAEPPLVSIWLGNRTVASAHYDMSNNIACCMVGRRRFTLFPPDQAANLYPGPLDPTPAGQVVTMVDFAAPDFDRFPRFREAMAAAQVAELEPGDVLVYPALWWHQVEALDSFNVLINYWWNSSPGFMDSPMNAVLYSLLSLRDRPDFEKRGWRELFDYYVFGPSDLAAAHLPAEARGNLAPLDELGGPAPAGLSAQSPEPITGKNGGKTRARPGREAGRDRRRRLGGLDVRPGAADPAGGAAGHHPDRVGTPSERWAWASPPSPRPGPSSTCWALDEREFMRETRATFKLGILFDNWGEIGDRYIHSFGVIGKSTLLAHFHHLWMQARDAGYGGDLGDYCLELKAAEASKFYTGENASLNYAYHIDATLFGRYLRGRCQKQGVKRIEGKIGEVQQHPETGFVEALVMESGERVEGDLFIDCTGFRGLLIEQTLKAGFEDWGHWLPNNSAVAVQTRTVEPAMPLTRATAHKAGWQWGIPLQHREGNGWVYCTDDMSDDEARSTFLGQLKGELLTEPWVVRFRPGRRRKSWDKNVIALGLAGGFIEPLESTSLHMIMIGVTRLLQLFPFGGVDPTLQDRFNHLADQEIIRIRDFIVMHYKLTERTDSPYWDRCRTMEIPDSLAQRIELFRETRPGLPRAGRAVSGRLLAAGDAGPKGEAEGPPPAGPDAQRGAAAPVAGRPEGARRPRPDQDAQPPGLREPVRGPAGGGVSHGDGTPRAPDSQGSGTMTDLNAFILAAALLLLTPGPTNTLLAAGGAIAGVRRAPAADHGGAARLHGGDRDA